ncbi:MAG: LCP family protein [Lachnospiraceae bacterium]|jgi:LCP family protein required for cell wall assembly|nr:LCP family protein [Lachnospiraceae bacterium]
MGNPKKKENLLDGVFFPVLSDRYTRRGREKRIRHFLAGAGCAFALMAAAIVLLFMALQSRGRAQLAAHADYHGMPDIAGLKTALADEYSELSEGQLYYKGRVYEYNDGILTFLVMGIDSRKDFGKPRVPGTAGQADMIVLAALDEKGKTLKLINISRDIMVPVETYDTSGLYAGTEELQLALQFAYGDGLFDSLRLMEGAVSRLFYGIPIHGSAAMEMAGVEKLNDAVGGVTLRVIEDLTKGSKNLVKDKTLTLGGRDALVYVRYRDTAISESNSLRNARQKQYLTAYYALAKEKTKENLSFPLGVYNIVKDNVVTSVTADQIAYLANAAFGCSLSEDDMMSVTGTIAAPGLYEEFRVDEEALLDMIMNVFYKTVD